MPLLGTQSQTGGDGTGRHVKDWGEGASTRLSSRARYLIVTWEFEWMDG